jgi:hypothetical protein
MSVRVLFIALKDGESSYEISLLEEIGHVWQLILLLLIHLIYLKLLVFGLSVRARAFASS